MTNTTSSQTSPITSVAWSTRGRGSQVRSRRQLVTHTVVAPRRFDVHRLGDVATWIDEAEALDAGKLIVDLAEVRFVDQPALDAIDMLLSNSTVAVECVNPSPAFALTARLVRRSRSLPSSPAELSVKLRAGSGRAGVADYADAMVIAITGDLTVANAHEFRSDVATLVAHGGFDGVTLDLSGVTRLDAAGLASVTSAALDLQRQGRRVTITEPKNVDAAQFARLTGVLPKLAAVAA